MHYEHIQKATFLERPNRFIARVLLNDTIETVHVKNTGRCKELLVKGATVYLEESDNPARKTRYDLIAVEKKRLEASPLLINMDSLAPNKAAAEWIRRDKSFFPHLTLLQPEYTLEDSRFDFYAEYQNEAGQDRQSLIEVKGCTLEQNGVALFPDAPTLRGLKHVQELTALAQGGRYDCMIVIIVQMTGCSYFTPNRKTQPAFADALIQARAAGVKILALECAVSPDSLTTTGEIPVKLEE